jgi:hypothetical protein
MAIYEIRLRGYLDQHWSEWFNGLTITYDEEGSTLLRGDLSDEAALHGILMKVRTLAVPLLAVQRAETNEPER